MSGHNYTGILTVFESSKLVFVLAQFHKSFSKLQPQFFDLRLGEFRGVHQGVPYFAQLHCCSVFP